MLKYEVKNETNYIYFDSVKSIKKISDLIQVLNKISLTNNHKVVLDFSSMKEQSYSSVHVSIAGIAQYYQEVKDFEFIFIERDGSYVSHTDLKSPLDVDANRELFKNNNFDKVVAFSNSNDVAFISEQIINQLKSKCVLEEGVLVGLSWCINEIMDNVFNHSKSLRGYIMAQIHRRKKDVSISIFDTGVGIYNSIKQSGEYVPDSEIDAISLALKKGVSGNRSIGQGNGMWGLKQIVEENKGYMAIYSGRTSTVYDFSNGTRKDNFDIPILSTKNLSTRIDFTLKFTNIININKALDNYYPYEKINRDIEEKINNYGYIVFKVKDEAVDGVGTRLSGKALKNCLLNLAKIDSHNIIIDFDEIDIISSSFADEFIGNLVSDIGFIQFMSKFRIVKTNKYIDGLINKAISSRQ